MFGREYCCPCSFFLARRSRIYTQKLNTRKSILQLHPSTLSFHLLRSHSSQTTPTKLLPKPFVTESLPPVSAAYRVFLATPFLIPSPVLLTLLCDTCSSHPLPNLSFNPLAPLVRVPASSQYISAAPNLLSKQPSHPLPCSVTLIKT